MNATDTYADDTFVTRHATLLTVICVVLIVAMLSLPKLTVFLNFADRIGG